MPSSCVCPCVCVYVSVTLRYCIKTAKRRIMQIMPHDSSATLVYTDKRVVRSLCHSRATCSGDLPHELSVFVCSVMISKIKWWCLIEVVSALDDEALQTDILFTTGVDLRRKYKCKHIHWKPKTGLTDISCIRKNTARKRLATKVFNKWVIYVYPDYAMSLDLQQKGHLACQNLLDKV